MKDGAKADRELKPDKGRKRQSSRPAANDGRSGYGSESVRPYLRAQLRMKELLVVPDFTPVRPSKQRG